MELASKGSLSPKRGFPKSIIGSQSAPKVRKNIKLGIFLKLENFWNRQHSRFNLSASGFREEKNWKKPNLILTRPDNSIGMIRLGWLQPWASFFRSPVFDFSRLGSLKILEGRVSRLENVWMHSTGQVFRTKSSKTQHAPILRVKLDFTRMFKLGLRTS